MCLAIAPNQKLNNGYFNRIWRIVSSTPLRLFSFCAFIHSLILGGLFVHNTTASAHIDLHVYISGFTYGILALVAYGYLLTWLPKKYSLTPIHYGQYTVICLFVMIGLVTLEIGIFFSNNWILAGMLLLIPAWLFSIQCLKDMHTWLNSDTQQISRVLVFLLLLNFSNLGFFILAWLYGSSELATLIISSSFFFSWPSIVVAALVLFECSSQRKGYFPMTGD
jgi:hypothetical protein